MKNPESVRRIPVRGTWAYVNSISVPPGGRLGVHVSAEAAHDIEIVRLGTNAVLDPRQPLDADRDEVKVLQTTTRKAAAPQSISPGSYIHVGGDPLPPGVRSMGAWVRLWQMPSIDVAQVGWQAFMTDIDYPEAARFGLLFDHVGRIGLYAGDGGAFRHEWLHNTPPVMKSALGRWVHVAASWSPTEVRIFKDGNLVHSEKAEIPSASATPRARLRIGAMAELGAAASFIEGDIAQPFVGAFTLDEAAAARLAEDRDTTPLPRMGLGNLLGWWPLKEERGATIEDESGNGRTGTLVNHGTWMIGGPRFDPARREPLVYIPEADQGRGHGLRLCGDDLMDADWEEAAHFDVPPDADSGLYAVRVRLAGQSAADACVTPFVVNRRRPRQPGAIALLAATNTWNAYGRRPDKEHIAAGLTSSFYSVHMNGRPFFHIGMRLPIPFAQPYAFESTRSTHTRSTHLVRTERFVDAWLRREGYPFEVISDADLHDEPDLLQHFAALAIVGHSEYWTDEARDGVLRYLDGGGKVLCLSGDTLTVRVTMDASRSVMEARKIVFDDDPRWLSPPMWGESWHSDDGLPGGTYRRLGKANWDVLGLAFKGMIDDGTPTAFAAYTVVKPDHFLFHTPDAVPFGDGRTIGNKSLNGSGGASGYEFDANPDRSGFADAPLPGVTTLASAIGQRNLEWVGERDHGADLIYWRRPTGGTVVNFGSIGVGGALAVDAGVATVVRNTLTHFGIRKMEVDKR
jgi:hypothetical protein